MEITYDQYGNKKVYDRSGGLIHFSSGESYRPTTSAVIQNRAMAPDEMDVFTGKNAAQVDLWPSFQNEARALSQMYRGQPMQDAYTKAMQNPMLMNRSGLEQNALLTAAFGQDPLSFQKNQLEQRAAMSKMQAERQAALSKLLEDQGTNLADFVSSYNKDPSKPNQYYIPGGTRLIRDADGNMVPMETPGGFREMPRPLAEMIFRQANDLGIGVQANNPQAELQRLRELEAKVAASQGSSIPATKTPPAQPLSIKPGVAARNVFENNRSLVAQSVLDQMERTANQGRGILNVFPWMANTASQFFGGEDVVPYLPEIAPNPLGTITNRVSPEGRASWGWDFLPQAGRAIRR